MLARTLGEPVAVVSALLGAMLAGGCTEPGGIPIVTGVLQHDATVALTKPFMLMRAVPDHIDGFEVSRDYHGDRVFADGCPTSHLEFPFPYLMVGDQDDVDGTDGVRWRVLVWETDDPNATWVRPGDAFGTAAFHFVDDPYGSWAVDVDVVIDQVAQ